MSSKEKDLDPRIKYYQSIDLPLTPALGIVPPIVISTFTGLGTGLVLKRIRYNDRQELTATVEWAPTITSGGAISITPTSAVVAGTVLPLTITQSVTLQIWRDVVGGVLCGQFTDTRSFSFPLTLPAIVAGVLTSVPIPATALAGLLATTTAEATDTGAPNGTYTYILTATAVAGTLLPGGLVGTVPVLTTLTIPAGTVGAPTADRVHFDGTVIDEN